MENIKDIISNIKERFTNPFFFAFFSSWLIINWKITLAVFWHDESHIKSLGFSSVFQFVELNLNSQNGLYNPLLCAIGYTLAIPILKNLIRAFQSWASKWGEDWNLNILDGAKISLNKYMILRKNYLIKAKTLSEVFEKETEFLEENRKLTKTIAENNQKNDEYYKQLVAYQDEKKEAQNAHILDGDWDIIVIDEIAARPVGGVSIRNGTEWYLIQDNSNSELTHNIKDFTYNAETKEAFFVIVPIKNILPVGDTFQPKVYKLKIFPPNTMEGEENYNNRVHFTRIVKQ